MRKPVSTSTISTSAGAGVTTTAPSRAISPASLFHREYANDVIYAVKKHLRPGRRPCPNIISESGRATVAHYSRWVTNILNTTPRTPCLDFEPAREAEKLSPTSRSCSTSTRASTAATRLARDYHDTIQPSRRQSALSTSATSTAGPAIASGCAAGFPQDQRHRRTAPTNPEECRTSSLACARPISPSFSLFQSLPDSWAIDQPLPDHADPDASTQKPTVRPHRRHHLRFRWRDHQLRRRKGRTKYLPIHRIDSDED